MFGGNAKQFLVFGAKYDFLSAQQGVEIMISLMDSCLCLSELCLLCTLLLSTLFFAAFLQVKKFNLFCHSEQFNFLQS